MWERCSNMELFSFYSILLLVCVLSERVRYHFKFMVFSIFSAIACSIFIPLMLFRVRHWKNALLPAWGVRNVGKWIGMNFEMRGYENIVKDTGCVVLVNHQSMLDLCALAYIWPVFEKCTVIAKKEILYFGTFGIASWLWGTIFIDRLSGGEAHDALNSTAKKIKDTKAKLCLFPEGHRYDGNNLLPFKKGAFHVAIASQIPIQPVVVSKYYNINHKLKIFNRGTNLMTILPPISTEGLTKEDLPELIYKTYTVMNEAFKTTTRESFERYKNRSNIE